MPICIPFTHYRANASTAAPTPRITGGSFVAAAAVTTGGVVAVAVSLVPTRLPVVVGVSPVGMPVVLVLDDTVVLVTLEEELELAPREPHSSTTVKLAQVSRVLLLKWTTMLRLPK